MITLIIAAGLLVATSQPGPPGSTIAQRSVIQAGERSATATVDGELAGGRSAGDMEPFTATIDVFSASRPAADGRPATPAAVDTTVRIDRRETTVRIGGGAGTYPDGELPAAGSCDSERCRIGYTLVFTLARQVETDVVVSWRMHIAGHEGLRGTLDVTVDGAVPFDEWGNQGRVDALGMQGLVNGTIAVRLDRVADADARIDLMNGGGQSIVVNLPDTRVTVPAGASARLTTFADCDQPTCTVHARLNRQVEDATLMLDGPVVATEIDARQRAIPAGTPTIRSGAVTRSLRLTPDAPTEYLELAIGGNAASGLSAGGASVEPQLAVRLQMRLTEAAKGTVVRYRPEQGTEPIVLSAAAGLGESQTIMVDVARHLAVRPELMSGRARVQITAEVVAAYPEGVPDGAAITAAFDE